MYWTRYFPQLPRNGCIQLINKRLSVYINDKTMFTTNKVWDTRSKMGHFFFLKKRYSQEC